jgi:hypothetical protein
LMASKISLSDIHRPFPYGAIMPDAVLPSRGRQRIPTAR